MKEERRFHWKVKKIMQKKLSFPNKFFRKSSRRADLWTNCLSSFNLKRDVYLTSEVVCVNISFSSLVVEYELGRKTGEHTLKWMRKSEKPHRCSRLENEQAKEFLVHHRKGKGNLLSFSKLHPNKRREIFVCKPHLKLNTL